MQHLQIDIVEDGSHRQTRIADQNIHPAKLLDGRLDELLTLLLLHNITRAVGRLTTPLADLARDELQLLHAARSQHHIGSQCGKFACQGLANTRRSTRHNDCLSLKIFHLSFI